MTQAKISISDLDYQEQVRITNMIMELLEDWEISNADKIVLLGLPEETRARSMARYHNETAFPNDEKIHERLEHLIGIANALRLANPRSEQEGARWLRRKNRRFTQRTPLETMLEDGLGGIVAVRMHIDCSYDWFIDEQRAKQQTEN
jgi:hypothetical protein